MKMSRQAPTKPCFIEKWDLLCFCGTTSCLLNKGRHNSSTAKNCRTPWAHWGWWLPCRSSFTIHLQHIAAHCGRVAVTTDRVFCGWYMTGKEDNHCDNHSDNHGNQWKSMGSQGEHLGTASSTDLRLHRVAVVPVVEAACAHLQLVRKCREWQVEPSNFLQKCWHPNTERRKLITVNPDSGVLQFLELHFCVFEKWPENTLSWAQHCKNTRLHHCKQTLHSQEPAAQKNETVRRNRSKTPTFELCSHVLTPNACSAAWGVPPCLIVAYFSAIAGVLKLQGKACFKSQSLGGVFWKICCQMLSKLTGTRQILVNLD